MTVPRAGLSPKSHCSTLALAGIMQLSPGTNMRPEVLMTRNVSARGPEKRARWSGVSRRSIVAVAMALMSTTAIGACASGHSQHRGGTDQQIIVHLTNDLTPPSDVTVYAVSQGGIRRLLGDVPPNKDRALKIPSDIFPGTSFRIVAERTGGRPVVSQPITATSGTQMIDWDLQTNAMWFPETAS
jgi:hypothetical protein